MCNISTYVCLVTLRCVGGSTRLLIFSIHVIKSETAPQRTTVEGRFLAATAAEDRNERETFIYSSISSINSRVVSVGSLSYKPSKY